MNLLLLITVVTAALTKIPKCGSRKSFSENITTINELIKIYNYPDVYNLKEKSAERLRTCYEGVTWDCKKKDKIKGDTSILDAKIAKWTSNKLPQSQVLRDLAYEKIAECHLHRYSCKGEDDADINMNAANLRYLKSKAPAKLQKKYDVSIFKCMLRSPTSPLRPCKKKDTSQELIAKINAFRGAIANYFGGVSSPKLGKLVAKHVLRCSDKLS